LSLIGREAAASIVAFLVAVGLAFGIVWRLLQLSEVTAAMAFIGVAAIVGVLWWGWGPRIEQMRRFRQEARTGVPLAQQPPAFLGGDELLRELERVDAACARLSGGLTVSGEDANPLIVELNLLRITLIEVEGKYTGIWTLNLNNKVTMVADQLREASSALSEGNLEHTRAHIDGAVQNVQALITYLKAPPLVNNEKKSA
jgi:hypothetical protein